LFAVTRSPITTAIVRSLLCRILALAHYLMVGDNAAHRPAFSQLTPCCPGPVANKPSPTRFGQLCPRPKGLQGCLARGRFPRFEFAGLGRSHRDPAPFALRALAPVEVCFSSRTNCFASTAPSHGGFTFARRKIAPTSPCRSRV
jgi:hypothetical protein